MIAQNSKTGKLAAGRRTSEAIRMVESHIVDNGMQFCIKSLIFMGRALQISVNEKRIL